MVRAGTRDLGGVRVKTAVSGAEGVWDREGLVLRGYVHNWLYSDVV